MTCGDGYHSPRRSLANIGNASEQGHPCHFLFQRDVEMARKRRWKQTSPGNTPHGIRGAPSTWLSSLLGCQTLRVPKQAPNTSMAPGPTPQPGCPSLPPALCSKGGEGLLSQLLLLWVRDTWEATLSYVGSEKRITKVGVAEL